MQLPAHKIGKAYVGSPHGFAQADGIAHYTQQRTVPCLTGIVHKNAVTAFNQVIGRACSQGGGDGGRMLLAAGVFTDAKAVEQAKVALGGQAHVGVHIVHMHAQRAGAAVDIQSASQEYGLVAGFVKIRK